MNISTNSSLNGVRCPQVTRWCQDSFRESYYFPIVCIIIISTVLALTAVIGNGLILLVYFKNTMLRTPANTVLLSLAITDFTTGVYGFPLFIYEKVLVLAHCTDELCAVSLLRMRSLVFLTGGQRLDFCL